MTSSDDSSKGICILSLDSGGPGTYSQLLILREYMSRLATSLGVSEEEVFPADYFDLIGGVGFGGLVAVMLGLLRMSVGQAMEELVTIASSLFRGSSQHEFDPNERSYRLKQVTEGMVLAEGLPLEAKMHEPTRPISRCRVVLYAATSTNLNQVHIFRSYSHRGTSLNPAIVDAVCATMSTPPHFSPMSMASIRGEQSFVGGPLGASNPTRELLKEAGSAFGADTRVAQIISLGAGFPPDVSLESTDPAEMAGNLMKYLVEDCEKVEAELSTRLFAVDAYVRLNVPVGVESTTLDDWRGLGAIEGLVNEYIETLGVTRVLERSITSLQQKDGSSTLGMINFSDTVHVAAKVAPAVCSHFVIRQQQWDTMVQHLVTIPSKNQKTFCITGMGGCGKTQLVSYFLQEKGSQYTYAVFVDASSASRLKADLQEWARSRGIGHEHSVWEDAITLLASGPHAGKWVLVLDNADNPDLDLAPFLPKCYYGTVIITSRNRDMGYLSNTHHLELGEMGTHEALSTLLRAAHREGDLSAEDLSDAHKLIKMLGCLAVALVQAGTYCYQLSMRDHGVPRLFTFAQYIELFSLQRFELMKRAVVSSLDEYQLGAYTSFDISYRAVPKVAKDFLHFISSFHHSNIPLEMISTAATTAFENPYTFIPRPEDHAQVLSHLDALLRINGQWDEKRAHQIIHTLRSFSLISASSIANVVFLHIHPLVQAWAKDITPPEFQWHGMMTLQVVTSCSFGENIRLYRYMLPHILDILGQIEVPDTHANDLMGISNVLRTQGYYREAIGLVQAGLEKMTNCAEQSAENTLTVTGILAALYLEGGRWDEAEKLELDALEQRRRVSGIDHPDTIQVAANLATIYQSQGRYSEAEKLGLEVLEQWKRVLGLEQPETFRAEASLAVTYQSQGRWSDAETLLLEVLEQQRRVLGIDHPDTIQVVANLATIYQFQGRLSEAEKLELEVLEQQTRVLGKEHPNTTQAAANLASTCRSQGRWSEAEKLEMEVLEQQTRILGKEHPNTIRTAANLALTYHSQGRWGEAEKLEADVLELQTKVLGKEHPETIIVAANLANTYHSQGRWSEAEKLQKEVLEQWKRVLGIDHPYTIFAAANLAATYEVQARWGEAEKLEVEVLEQQKRVLGDEHPATIQTTANLAVILQSQGRWSEAEKLKLEVLEQWKRVLGMEHPDTIGAASNLAVTYHSQGRWSEAEKLQKEVLEQRQRVLGMEHPDTIKAVANLASIYHSQGIWSTAEDLEVEVLDKRKRVLGSEHPDTIVAAANLAVTYQKQGRLDDAVTVLAPAVELGVKVFGRQHPNTQEDMRTLVGLYEELGKLREAEQTKALLQL